MIFLLRKTELHDPILVGCATEVKFLGAYLDPGLTWKGYIVSISKVLSSYLFLIRNLVKITSRNTVLTAYYGYFHSYLLYAVLTWGHSGHTK